MSYDREKMEKLVPTAPGLKRPAIDFVGHRKLYWTISAALILLAVLVSVIFGVKIDINDEGNVFVSGVDMDGAKKAIQIINTIANDPEIGAIYKGKVVRLMNFGAFVEIAPGKDGLVHISKLDRQRVEKVEDVVSVGDEIVVKVMEIDNQGRINLSRRDALADLEAKQNSQG